MFKGSIQKSRYPLQCGTYHTSAMLTAVLYWNLYCMCCMPCRGLDRTSNSSRSYQHTPSHTSATAVSSGCLEGSRDHAPSHRNSVVETSSDLKLINQIYRTLVIGSEFGSGPNMQLCCVPGSVCICACCICVQVRLHMSRLKATLGFLACRKRKAAIQTDGFLNT